jgi:hypothetical protein
MSTGIFVLCEAVHINRNDFERIFNIGEFAGNNRPKPTQRRFDMVSDNSHGSTILKILYFL